MPHAEGLCSLWLLRIMEMTFDRDATAEGHLSCRNCTASSANASTSRFVDESRAQRVVHVTLTSKACLLDPPERLHMYSQSSIALWCSADRATSDPFYSSFRHIPGIVVNHIIYIIFHDWFASAVSSSYSYIPAKAKQAQSIQRT